MEKNTNDLRKKFKAFVRFHKNNISSLEHEAGKTIMIKHSLPKIERKLLPVIFSNRKRSDPMQSPYRQRSEHTCRY